MSRQIWFASSCGLVVAACSGHEPAGGASQEIASHRQPIIAGAPSPKEQDSVIQLSVDIGGHRSASCTGSLIAKNLVLTARHCVMGHVKEDGSLDDYPPAMLLVFVGASAPQQVERNFPPAARGAQLIVAPTKHAIPDIALLRLDRSVEAPVAPIRLRRGVKPGENLTIVGFGIDETNEPPPARMQRTGVSVLALGPATRNEHEIFSGEFTVGAAACSGDSGGPALSAKSSAIVGVASRVGTEETQDKENPSAICLGEQTEVVYTTLQPLDELLEEAFAAAGATPILEGADPAAIRPTAPPPAAATASEREEEPTNGEATPAGVGSPATARETRTSGCATSPARSGESVGACGLAAALAAVLGAKRRVTASRRCSTRSPAAPRSRAAGPRAG